MSTAVRSLRDDGKYNGKLRFYVIGVNSEKVRAEVARWNGLGNHGLVGTTPKGQLKVMIPGHNFDSPQIIAKADELLRSTSPP